MKNFYKYRYIKHVALAYVNKDNIGLIVTPIKDTRRKLKVRMIQLDSKKVFADQSISLSQKSVENFSMPRPENLHAKYYLEFYIRPFPWTKKYTVYRVSPSL